jgi:hypothetical protein
LIFIVLKGKLVIGQQKAVVMNEHDEKIDSDILKGREDIQRALRTEEPGDPEKSPPRRILREPSPIMKAVVDANRQKNLQRGTSDIPAFDVSQKILARQRQSTTAKRTAPLKRSQPETSGPAHIQTRVEYSRPLHNSLVADIVARDIDRYCRG